MRYLDNIVKDIMAKEEEKKELHLGERFGNIVHFEELIEDHDKRWDKYKKAYCEVTKREYKGNTYIHEYLAPEKDVFLSMISAFDADGKTIYDEISLCDRKNDFCCLDRYKTDNEMKYEHYEATIEIMGRIVTKKDTTYFTNNRDDLNKAIKNKENIENSILEMQEKIVVEDCDDIKEL